MTQLELAKRLNVTPHTVYSWEAGIRNPKPSRLDALAAVLGKPPEWFFSLDRIELFDEKGNRLEPTEMDSPSSTSSLVTTQADFPDAPPREVTLVGEAIISRNGQSYTMVVGGLTVTVHLNQRTPHVVTVNGRQFDPDGAGYKEGYQEGWADRGEQN